MCFKYNSWKQYLRETVAGVLLLYLSFVGNHPVPKVINAMVYLWIICYFFNLLHSCYFQSCLPKWDMLSPKISRCILYTFCLDLKTSNCLHVWCLITVSSLCAFKSYYDLENRVRLSLTGFVVVFHLFFHIPFLSLFIHISLSISRSFWKIRSIGLF